MFRPRPRPSRLLASAIATPCLALLVGYFPLGEAGGDHAASAAGTNATWQPSSQNSSASTVLTSSSSREAQPNAAAKPLAKSAPQWRLPNASATHHAAQQPSTQPAARQTAANPLRRNQSNALATREPRLFQSSGTASPLKSSQAAGNTPTPTAPRHSASAAVAQSSAATPRAGSALAANRLPAARPATMQQPARPRPNSAQEPASYTSKVWDTVQVAFQGPQVWTGEAENLPLPATSGRGAHRSQPMHEFHDGPMTDERAFNEQGDGTYMQGEGMYIPYGESAAGCDDGSCSTCHDGGCPCGCSEAGCHCEPGCGCHTGGGCGESPCMVACGDDICLMGHGDAEACHTIRIGVPKWQELMVFGGVQGFKGPYDQTRDSGNFGFHEGFNAGFKVPFTHMGYQIGYRATHSQLNGDKNTDIADPHTQQFITAGMFQRVKDGVQWGIAWDMLRDERFHAVDFHQLRGELSLIDRGCHEFGIAAAVHLNEHEPFPADDETPSVLYQASDQYLLFYRIHAARGGEGRFYGGFNDDEDGIIGADLLLPLKDRWSLATGFTYLIPDEPAGEQGATHEAWNIGMALVWHWDCRARKSHSNCYRPLFNVADNGYLIVDQRLGAPATGGN